MEGSIKIGSKTYKLRYRLTERALIEDRAGGDRALLTIMQSGRIQDQAWVVWAGIKGADRDVKVTAGGLIEDFQRHNDRGNGADYYADIVVPAYVQMAESGLLGAVNLHDFKRAMGFREEGKDEAGPEPDTVRAQE